MTVYVLQLGSGSDGDEREVEGVYDSEARALAVLKKHYKDRHKWEEYEITAYDVIDRFTCTVCFGSKLQPTDQSQPCSWCQGTGTLDSPESPED